MSIFIEVLRSWFDERGHRGQLRPWMTFREPSVRFPKASAAVTVEEPEVMGHVIVWETGECEVDVGSTRDPDRTLIKTAQLSSKEDLTTLMDEIVAFCEGLMSQ